jgi:hypothetical protein
MEANDDTNWEEFLKYSYRFWEKETEFFSIWTVKFIFKYNLLMCPTFMAYSIYLD